MAPHTTVTAIRAIEDATKSPQEKCREAYNFAIKHLNGDYVLAAVMLSTDQLPSPSVPVSKDEIDRLAEIAAPIAKMKNGSEWIRLSVIKPGSYETQ